MWSVQMVTALYTVCIIFIVALKKKRGGESSSALIFFAFVVSHVTKQVCSGACVAVQNISLGEIIKRVQIF